MHTNVLYVSLIVKGFFSEQFTSFFYFCPCDGQCTSDDPQFVWDVRRDAGLESTLTRTCVLFFCCFELDFWNSHSAPGQALDQAPAWEHSEAQYIQIFSPSLRNNEVTVITSVDISFGYQRRSRPSTSVPLPSCSSEWLSKIFNLLQVIVCSPTVFLLHWVSRWDYPAFTATALPLVIAHTGSPFLSLSPSPIFSGCPKAFASLQAPPLPFLCCSPILHWSRLTPLNFQSPVSQPFLCVPAFSFSFNCLFLLFLQAMSCLRYTHPGLCLMRSYVSVNHTSARYPFYTPTHFISDVFYVSCLQKHGELMWL